MSGRWTADPALFPLQAASPRSLNLTRNHIEPPFNPSQTSIALPLSCTFVNSARRQGGRLSWLSGSLSRRPLQPGHLVVGACANRKNRELQLRTVIYDRSPNRSIHRMQFPLITTRPRPCPLSRGPARQRPRVEACGDDHRSRSAKECLSSRAFSPICRAIGRRSACLEVVHLRLPVGIGM